MSTTTTLAAAPPEIDTADRIRHGSMDYFRRLLAQRRLFGQLAECQRSHKGQDTTTDMLDSVVNLLTDELEIRFPDDWADHEPDLLLDEAAMLHDPAAGLVVGCGICHQHQQAAAQERQRRKTRTGRKTKAPGRRVATSEVA